MKDFLSRKFPFILLLSLIFIMASATFLEKEYGAEFVHAHVYRTSWFIGIWAVLAIGSLTGMIKRKLYKRLPLFILHFSFIIILTGALFTRLFAIQGYIVLNKGESRNFMTSDTGIEYLPFEVQLDTFFIEYYPGSDAPANYISLLSLKEPNTDSLLSKRVAMNEILKYKQYRFYQSSFDNNMETSILSVNKDVWGIPVTYTGYLLFALSGCGCLFFPKTGFRKLLRTLKKAIPLLFLFPLSSQAGTLTPDSLSVNKQQAGQFAKVQLLYEGRITPVATLAHDFTVKIVGKPSFNYLNANQFFMGFLFFPEKWNRIAIFKVKEVQLQKELGLIDYKAAWCDFFDEQGNYKLKKYGKEISRQGAKTSLLKEVEKLNDNIRLIRMLHSGYLLKMYPQRIDNRIQWLYPTEGAEQIKSPENLRFIRTSLLEYYQALIREEENKATEILTEIKNFQSEYAGEILPSETKRDVEIFYLKTNLTSWLFKINLTFGISALILLFLPLPHKKTVNRLFFLFLGISFLIHTFSIGMRIYISERLPVGNGFETMMLIAWCSMLFALIFGLKTAISVPFGFLLSGFSLLVAHLGMMNPQMTPLVPVLSSPLLSIHVSLIMISYTLLGFIMLNGLISMIHILITPIHKSQMLFQTLALNKIYSLLCLYPGLLLLGCGIFTGAVWANISWGRYWGWDPKEVWALITFLTYSLLLHEKNLKRLIDPFFFHLFGILAFGCVLMTYFGVNYFLGGIHSYAGTIRFSGTGIIIIGILLFIGLLIKAHSKYKKIQAASSSDH